MAALPDLAMLSALAGCGDLVGFGGEVTPLATIERSVAASTYPGPYLIAMRVRSSDFGPRRFSGREDDRLLRQLVTE